MSSCDHEGNQPSPEAHTLENKAEGRKKPISRMTSGNAEKTALKPTQYAASRLHGVGHECLYLFKSAGSGPLPAALSTSTGQAFQAAFHNSLKDLHDSALVLLIPVWLLHLATWRTHVPIPKFLLLLVCFVFHRVLS